MGEASPQGARLPRSQPGHARERSQNRARQDRAEPGRARQGKAGQGRRGVRTVGKDWLFRIGDPAGERRGK